MERMMSIITKAKSDLTIRIDGVSADMEKRVSEIKAISGQLVEVKAYLGLAN
jgi:hypothetical protein